MTGSVIAADKSYRYIPVRIVFSVVFAFLTALSANVFIYIPFTPVPVTLQVLTVITSAFMLGSRWALASQILYIIMGLSGIPVFAGFSGGPAVLMGPTAGYIAGFAVSAYITGLLFERSRTGSIFRGNTYAAALVSGMAGLSIIYFLGAFYLSGYIYSAGATKTAAEAAGMAWQMGISPFIIPDLVKIFIAVNIYGLQRRRDEYNKNK
jgi:biotin transport system substrate-specific component